MEYRCPYRQRVDSRPLIGIIVSELSAAVAALVPRVGGLVGGRTDGVPFVDSSILDAVLTAGSSLRLQ